jgi:ATP-dependent helicase/nuclease subunit B
LEEAFQDFACLLARLRGRATLCYSCRDVAEDREMFPSSALLSVFRHLTGRPEADQAEFVGTLPPPVSLAPADASEALDAAEWWLTILCGPRELDSPQELVLRHFPHLANGARARAERGSDRVTIYDGWVPAAGLELDPCRQSGPAMSAASLETIGACPLRFFYKYALRLEPPDELLMDPSRWLDSLTFGSLVHTVFEHFMRERIERGELPMFERDYPRLRAILAEHIDRYRDEFPSPNEAAYQRQKGELEQAAATFLREEEHLCQTTGSRPVYLEASLGMKSDGQGTALDMDDPVRVTLPSGKSLRARGRIDRIDLLAGKAVQTYAVWDYKSGSAWRYDRAKPFRQGRVMQPWLYVTIVHHRLREVVSPTATVKQFGFFFPSEREAGGRMVWSCQKLEEGRQILNDLCQMIHQGAFLATNDHVQDCAYCDFRAICGNVEGVAQASQRKLENAGNAALEPLRRLREVV